MTDETKAAVPGDQAQGPVWRKWRRTLFTRDEKGKLYFAGILIFLVGFVLYLTGMIVIPRIPEWFCVG